MEYGTLMFDIDGGATLPKYAEHLQMIGLMVLC